MSATPPPLLDTSQKKGHVRNTSSVDERRGESYKLVGIGWELTALC